MEITIYFTTGFFSEESTIFKATDIEKIENSNDKKFVRIANTETSTSKLYKDGWKLVQVIQLDDFCSSQLIFERPTK